MKPTNLTNIDFDDIRESIKSYMRTRPELSDYDFTGSTLSYLLDILAYNTYYSAFNANMALNEVFLDSASIRDNVTSLAKLLNYTPRSAKASKACISVEVQTSIAQNNTFPLLATLKKGNICNGTTDGKSYSFVITEDRTVRVNSVTGIAKFDDVTVYEGNLLTYEYIVDTTTEQRYLIPNEKVDTELLSVRIKPNIQSTESDKYNLVQNITSIDSSTRSYFLSEDEDRRYRVSFGDGIVGRKLEDGQVIILEYVTTNGIEANNIQQFSFTGQVVDSDGREIDDISLTVKAKSQIGDVQESLKSIKFNAPKYYAAQNRAVTAKDYESLTKIIYPNARFVNAYGGETLTPPTYGKVFLSIRTKTGARLNNLTKNEIIRNLRPYGMASIDVVIEDPKEIFVDLNMLVITKNFVTNFGDGTLSESTAEKLRNKAIQALKEYGDSEDLSNFGKTFSVSKLHTDILQSDKNIEDVISSVSLYKVENYPLESNPKSFRFNFGTQLNCTCSTTPGKTIQSSVYYTTDKPGVPQFFEDDGFGKLRSYTLVNNAKVILDRNVGTYSCETGSIVFGPVNIEGQEDLETTLLDTLSQTLSTSGFESTVSGVDGAIGVGTGTLGVGAGTGAGTGVAAAGAGAAAAGAGVLGTGAIGGTQTTTSGFSSSTQIGSGTGTSLIPTSISVGVSPFSPTLSPSAILPGAVMSFITPSVGVVPSGSPVISSFVTGGVPGTPTNIGFPSIQLLTFVSPLTTPTSGTISGSGSCFI
jgi:hypothetical protein